MREEITMKDGTSATGERLRHALDRISSETGVAGFIVFTMDGLPLVSHIDKRYGYETLREMFSTIGAGLISLAGSTLKHVNMLPMERITIESSQGIVLLERISDDIGIMTLASSSIPMGIIRIASERAKGEVLKFLNHQE